MITVVALGPDDAGLLTIEALKALKDADGVLLRTGRHGAAALLEDYDTLDALYDGAEDFDTLNALAAETVLTASQGKKSFCYGVADPATDATVRALIERGAKLRVLAGVSQTDTARAKALEHAMPESAAVVTIPASAFSSHRLDPACALFIVEINSRLLAGEIKLRLLTVYAPDSRALFEGREIALEDLDRQKAYSHLSALYLPQSPRETRDRYTYADLLDIMARLRRPGDGCPWDLEQTHESLRQYIIEEAYEVVEAIDGGDPARVADELGDMLLQVLFHAQIAREHGEFDEGDITTAICRKMISRHAHIFGDIHCETAEDVLTSWEAIKKKEKGLRKTGDVMRDVPGHLPALMRASKVQNKAKQVGFDWDAPAPALDKVLEEAGEVRAELAAGRDPQAELGDLLFAAVNAARLAGVQPELALGAATEKFIRRFERMEAAILADGKSLKDMSLPEMDAYWEAVKRAEKEA